MTPTMLVSTPQPWTLTDPEPSAARCHGAPGAVTTPIRFQQYSTIAQSASAAFISPRKCKN